MSWRRTETTLDNSPGSSSNQSVSIKGLVENKLQLLEQERKFDMYIKYCENKPKSEDLVYEHLKYFEVGLNVPISFLIVIFHSL